MKKVLVLIFSLVWNSFSSACPGPRRASIRKELGSFTQKELTSEIKKVTQLNLDRPVTLSLAINLQDMDSFKALLKSENQTEESLSKLLEILAGLLIDAEQLKQERLEHGMFSKQADDTIQFCQTCCSMLENQINSIT